jgi:hypothetical protein
VLGGVAPKTDLIERFANIRHGHTPEAPRAAYAAGFDARDDLGRCAKA